MEEARNESFKIVPKTKKIEHVLISIKTPLTRQTRQVEVKGPA